MSRIEAPQQPHTAEGTTRTDVPALVGGILMTVLFAAAFVPALEWDRQAAIFPLAVSGLGVVLGITVTVRTLLRSRRAAPAEDEADAEEADNVFADTPKRDLVTSLAYFAGFFLALYALGLYIAVPVFTLLYLRAQAGKSWVFSAVYSGVLVTVLYVLFDVLMQQPVPPGLF